MGMVVILQKGGIVVIIQNGSGSYHTKRDVVVIIQKGAW